MFAAKLMVFPPRFMQVYTVRMIIVIAVGTLVDRRKGGTKI